MAAAAREGETRRHVLDCAARLFSREGYAAVSLRGIAAESGIKAGSLYYHFESKEEIVIEILNVGVQLVHAAVERAIGALPPQAPVAQGIGVAMEAHLQALHKASDYTSANIRIFGQLPQSVQNAHRPVRRSYDLLWSELLGRGVRSGELRDDINIPRLRAFLLGSMNSSLERYNPKSVSVARLASDLAAVVLYGAAYAAPLAAPGPALARKA